MTLFVSMYRIEKSCNKLTVKVKENKILIFYHNTFASKVLFKSFFALQNVSLSGYLRIQKVFK